MAGIKLKERFGTSVKSWRSRLGISQEQLAERAGLHRTYISDIERGARNVSLESIDKLAKALQIPLSTLFNCVGEDMNGVENVLESESEWAEILFAEDDEDDIALTINALQAAKFANHLHLVRDGEDALNYLFGEDRASRPAPDLILLDLNLPKLSGLDVLRRIKAEPRTQSIPVVVLTSSRHSADIATSKRLGANAYIVKPVGLKNLSDVTPQLSMQWALLKGEELAPA